jgi:superfamily II DNA or RNA helicase
MEFRMLQRLLFVLIGLALAGVQPAFAKNPPPSCPNQIIDHDAIRALTEKMLIKVVRPVLEEAGRFGGSGIQIDLPNNGLGRIDVRTSHGTFHIQLTREDKPEDRDLGQAIPPFEFDPDFRMTGVVLIQERWLEDSFLKRDKNLELIQGLVRCLMIGDPNVSPHMRSPRAPDSQESELSYLQQDVFAEAMKAIARYRTREPNRVPRLGIMGPGGMGKTILVGKIAKEFFASRGQTDGVVVFTVHSDSILNSAHDKLVRELGLREDEVWVHYGNSKRKALPPNPSKIKLVLTSRTGLKQLCEREHIDQVVKPGGRKRSTLLVKDEAQHIPAADGEEGGEYMQAMAHLEGKIGVTPELDDTSKRLLNEQDLILMISATLTHSTNPGLISDRRFLDSSVIGVLLDDAEQDQLRRGNNTDVMNLAVTQSLRAMVRGYLAWINFVKVELIRDSDGKKVLNRTVVEPDENGQMVRREVVDQGAVDKVAKQIMAVRAEHPQVVNRTLIFVDGTRRAELWSQMLQEKLRELEGNLAHPSVVHHHSSRASSFSDAEDWLMDRQVKRYTRGGTLLGTDYNTDSDRATHKYVVVDSKMGEGTDVPCINMIVIAREVDATDTGAMVRLFQNILRGTRVFAYKQRLHLLDYSGAVTPLLERRLTLRPLIVKEDDDGGEDDGDDEPKPPPPPTGDPLATQMGLFGQNPITELILAAQSGQATEYGSDVSIEDVWLLRRMPFDTQRPEGQHLAKMVLKLLRSTESVDIASLWSGSESDKAFARKLNASGLSALVEQYKSIHARIKLVFKDYADFMALKDAGMLPDEAERNALELMLVEAGNALSSDIVILDFGQKTRKYVMSLDPMRGKPMQMTLVYRGDGRMDPKLLENMEELYRAVGDQRTGGLYELEHQSFWMNTLEASTDKRVIKIVGENVWPFLYADVGRHVWTNQTESGPNRGNGALHSKDVVVFAEAEQEADLLALPKPVRDKMTPLATTSSGFPIVRKYDAKANPTPEIRSNDFPLMPGPMRAGAYIQSGKLLLDPRGMRDYASILRRNMSVYFIPLLEQELMGVQPYLPKPPAADAASPVADVAPPSDGETPTADPTSPPDQP